MAKPFDATLKELIENYPGDWLAPLELTATGPITVIDADLSTVTTQADKIIRVDDPEPWLLHIDLQASWKGSLDRRALKYNVLAHDRHELPVHSALVLLRPEADATSLTGIYRYQPPHGGSEVVFSYQVVRLWQQPVELFLGGGPGVLPLAPLCAVAWEALPGVIRQMEARIEAEAPPGARATLWTSTYILLGLRFPPEAAAELLRGVRDMKESSTYQAILDEGRSEGIELGRSEGIQLGRSEGSVAEARRLLLLLGIARFGPPDEQVRAAIEGMDSIERLEPLTVRVLDAAGWDELLAEA
jgi:predicted transposase YdaD